MEYFLCYNTFGLAIKKFQKNILTYGKLYYIIILIKEQYKKIIILKSTKKENLS